MNMYLGLVTTAPKIKLFTDIEIEDETYATKQQVSSRGRKTTSYVIGKKSKKGIG